MTPEESQIIREVFARIRSAGPIPNDPQARAAINQEMIANPDAGIGLIQLLVGLEQQRAQLAQERDQLAAQVRNASGQSTGGGLFGRATPPPPPPPQAGPWGAQQYSAPPQPSAPWGAAQQPAAPQSSFLRTALGSAAGMAGGLFAFEALRDVFGGHNNGGLFGGGYNSGFGGTTEYITENNYVNDDSSGGYSDSSGGFDTSSDDSSSFGGDDSSFG